MSRTPAFSRLQEQLGYQFKDEALLLLAMTHSSHSRLNNERLEYLGDSMLNFLIAQELYQRFPKAREGELSRLRAHLVNGSSLAGIARELQLGSGLRLGAGERKSGGADRESILADAVEALIGAILLDGGELACRSTVISWFENRLQGLSVKRPVKDAKTRLQEFLQGHGKTLPEYRVLDVSGEAHEQEFEVSCSASGLASPCVARGRSRRLAEQKAAAMALRQLGGDFA